MSDKKFVKDYFDIDLERPFDEFIKLLLTQKARLLERCPEAKDLEIENNAHYRDRPNYVVTYLRYENEGEKLNREREEKREREAVLNQAAIEVARAEKTAEREKELYLKLKAKYE